MVPSALHPSRSASRRARPVLRSLLAAVGALALLMATGCASTGGGDAQASARWLAQLDDDWSAAAAARDVERVASYYADDAIAYPPNEPAAHGRAAAKAVWAAYLADPSFSISWKTTHSEVSPGGDLGFTAGTYEDSFRGPDGRMVHEVGKYLCVWRKQADGSWKAIHDMWNADGR